jgi:hypothetical protein
MRKWWKRYKFLMLGILMVAAIMAIYAYREYNRGLPDTHHLEPAFKLDEAEFVRQFEADESKANTRFADKTISVQGIVGAVHVTDSSTSIYLNDGSSMASVMCQFEKKNIGEAKNLKRGDHVTIKGICSGYLMDVILVRCVLER